ncbi:RIMS-binding protein 2-like isoform X2 [Corythoichthys intestinalis]|uniref:RIMS-binding protein 2-like isoform X2 n=1 Tax=Corythoichthys intestinalis TaxID=161448 RepID=UPI0025A6815B|nr:RIMS-binding protein 2-like isoform X2 [Corythoichthys intestinalis]XP_057695869.1 RIMS-binding protein 2-like isoform X2 [Corythoichthys intestinalis]XP_061797603.1 RIMS-binding protein 2-like [Nerophis lumbriciformis]
MDSVMELDVLIYPDEVRVVTPEDLHQWELETASQASTPALEPRLFVALYPYNPAAMSPNPDTAAEELPFVPGQIIKVFGDKDLDGFYHGESGGLSGYVPSNLVAEVPVDDHYLKHLLMQQGFIPVDQTGMSLTPDVSDVSSVPEDVIVRRMVALFDYDPWESSPNADSEVEMGFRSGDIIYVLGDMDADGFYYGDLQGRRGLVPSNFLQPLPWD